MRAHRTPARRPYMAGGAARRAWPEESGRGVDRDGVLTAGRTAGPREGGPGLPLEERLLRSFPRSVSAPRQFGVAHTQVWLSRHPVTYLLTYVRTVNVRFTLLFTGRARELLYLT